MGEQRQGVSVTSWQLIWLQVEGEEDEGDEEYEEDEEDNEDNEDNDNNNKWVWPVGNWSDCGNGTWESSPPTKISLTNNKNHANKT